MSNTVKKLAVKATPKKAVTSSNTVIRKTSTAKASVPLTKKILIKAAAVGFSKAATKTMKVMGYNIIVKDGWVVKKFADGRTKKISKLERTNKPVSLD